jgi:hypothetical protein
LQVGLWRRNVLRMDRGQFPCPYKATKRPFQFLDLSMSLPSLRAAFDRRMHLLGTTRARVIVLD